MSRAEWGPRETTEEKPTALLAAQSSMDEVREPDCDTRARLPLRARGPATLALSCEGGRWMPRPLGPSRYTPA